MFAPLYRYVYRQWLRADLYRRCYAALMQGHMARVFMMGETYCEGTEEHEAWRMGLNGVERIWITDDLRVKAL